MSGNIERRISKGLLSQFLYGDNRYYSSMEKKVSIRQDYKKMIRDNLPENWRCQKQRIWYFLSPVEHDMPDYGFKIHISLTSDITAQFLPAIINALTKENIAFKLLADTEIQDFHNSQSCNRISCGKFMTAYPSDLGIFKRTLQSLYDVTEGAYGPYVLSDKAYRDSRCLFYRYGAFKGNRKRDVLGEIAAPIINFETGETDCRLPYFQLPEGVQDPFATEETESESSLFNNRFEVTGCVSSHSSKGGVYTAKDMCTGDVVILKEARPFINKNSKGKQDAITGLKHEEAILRSIESTGVTPKVIDSFQEWQHRFLVLEQIQGQSLAYVERKHLANISLSDSEEILNFYQWYLQVLRNLIMAVEVIHNEGVTIGDIAPQNIIIDVETLEIKLIDFEGAYAHDQGWFYAPITSMGFSHHKSRPSVADDWQAVANIALHLLHPICTYFTLNPSRKEAFWTSLIRKYRLPEKLSRLPREISEGAEQALAFISECKSSITHVTDIEAEDNSDINMSEIISEIRRYILSFVSSPLPETGFPLDYRALSSNSLGVAYGSAGIQYFLNETTQDKNAEIESIASSHLLDNLDDQTLFQLSPGLYHGVTGIAWILLDMGFTEQAEHLMKYAYRMDTLEVAQDLFYGSSGWGLASIYFYHRTGRAEYLDKALEAERSIKKHLTQSDTYLIYKNIDGHCYSGLMHGNAGLALFYLRLYQVTRDEAQLAVGMNLLKSEVARAEMVNGKIAWRKDYSDKATYPYLRFGAAGIGQVLLRYYRELQQSSLLQLAEQIARSLQGSFCVYPSQFLGMSGIGGFYLDLYRDTGSESYLQEASHLARRIILYGIEDVSGLAFPGEELARISCDVATGSAGIGLYFNRLKKAGSTKELFIDF